MLLLKKKIIVYLLLKNIIKHVILVGIKLPSLYIVF